jgi:hypothetical protein
MSGAGSLGARRAGSLDGAVEAYEQLRSGFLNERGGARRELGLVLFMRRGMTAWFETWSSWTARHDAGPSSQPDGGPRLPSGLRGEIAMVLAGMALGSHLREVGI